MSVPSPNSSIRWLLRNLKALTAYNFPYLSLPVILVHFDIDRRSLYDLQLHSLRVNLQGLPSFVHGLSSYLSAPNLDRDFQGSLMYSQDMTIRSQFFPSLSSQRL